MRFLAVLSFCLLAFPLSSLAAPPTCSVVSEGVIVYNKDHKVMQYCDGVNWIGMSGSAAESIDTLSSLSCANNEIAKWNGSTWACAADASGLPALTSANIWVGNGSNAATAVAMSGDATLSNAGVLTIGSNAIGSAEITNASVALADLSATGTASAATYLRGDNTWATISTGLPALTSASIWVGNGSNAATAVAMSGDATLTNAGVLTIGANAIGSSEITNASIALADLSATGTASASTYLRGDNTWATVAASVPGGSTGNVQFNNGTAFAGDSALFWNNTTKRLGIGTANPLTDLHMQNTAAYTPQIRAEHIGDTSGYFIFSRAKGTPALKTAVGSGDTLGNLLSQGYDGTTNVNSAYIAFAVDGPVSTGVVPGAFSFVTMNSAGSTTTKMTLSSAGNLGLGISPTSNRLEVSGTVSATSFAGSGASLTSIPAANLTGTLPAISGANLTTLNASNLASGTVAAARMPALTGDVTMPVGTTATTIAAGVVTATELANDAVTIPKLAATGTASSTTFLRGDNTWAAPSSGGGAGDVQSFTASGTWTKPSSGTLALIECWGAGGSGARINTTSASGAPSAGGGGGGGYLFRWVPLSALGATETVTIGIGGASITSGATDGHPGGTTTFGAWLSAYGGGPGGRNTRSGGAGGDFYGTGLETTAPANGDFFSGGDGAPYHVIPPGNAINGGAGGGGMSYRTGCCTFTANSGGTSMGGGNGGNAAIDTTNASPGTQPGGGGGGAQNGNSGKGGNGKCVVTSL